MQPQTSDASPRFCKARVSQCETGSLRKERSNSMLMSLFRWTMNRCSLARRTSRRRVCRKRRLSPRSFALLASGRRCFPILTSMRRQGLVVHTVDPRRSQLALNATPAPSSDCLVIQIVALQTASIPSSGSSRRLNASPPAGRTATSRRSCRATTSPERPRLYAYGASSSWTVSARTL